MGSVDGLSFGSVIANLSAGVGRANPGAAKSNPAVERFLDYMKKSAAERMADAWLAAHGLTRADLNAMDPEKRDALLKKMAQDIKAELEQAAEKKSKPGAGAS
jgi:acyl-CoA reductase-like NAD-dependent aldehyde dehydrogenase